MLAALSALVLACSGTAPRPPEQRLCAPGQSSETWMRERIADRGAEAVFAELQIGTPLVWCSADGSEERGDLMWVVVEKLDVDGERILRGRKWLEAGRAPRAEPRAISWRADRLSGPQPVSFLLTVRQAR